MEHFFLEIMCLVTGFIFGSFVCSLIGNVKFKFLGRLLVLIMCLFILIFFYSLGRAIVDLRVQKYLYNLQLKQEPDFTQLEDTIMF